MKMNIAIIDDEEKHIKEISKIVSEIYGEYKYNVRIETFKNPELLIYNLEEQQEYDLFLLDIEMPQISGLEVAKKIRDSCAGAFIVLITSHEKYALKGYEVSAYRYVKKDKIYIQLPQILLDIYNKYQEGRRSFYAIESNYRYEKIYHKDILYIYKKKSM